MNDVQATNARPGRANDLESGRLRREWRTVSAMIAIVCRAQHGGGRRSLCPHCQELHDYAHERLRRCPFGAGKPTCANCQVHCYRREMRERVQAVMRFAGPRMMTRHPYLALMHVLVDGRRPAPVRPPRLERIGSAPAPAAPAAPGAPRT